MNNLKFWHTVSNCSSAIAIIGIIIFLFFKKYVPINHMILSFYFLFIFLGFLSLLMKLIIKRKRNV